MVKILTDKLVMTKSRLPCTKFVGKELENSMMLSRKKLGTRPWKTHGRQQSIPNCRLVMTKESSPDDDDTYRKRK